MTSFRTREELEALGFRSIGENVLISRNATIYSAGVPAKKLKDRSRNLLALEKAFLEECN